MGHFRSYCCLYVCGYCIFNNSGAPISIVTLVVHIHNYRIFVLSKVYAVAYAVMIPNAHWVTADKQEIPLEIKNSRVPC